MKKFSFLLTGAFLLWTIAFTLAEDSKALTGSMAWMPNTINSSISLITGSNTWNSTETTTWNTATEATTTEATTWDTTEGTEATTAEVTTWDTTEVADTTADTTAETTWTTEATETTVESTDSTTPTISDSAKQIYDEEQIAAYKWAYNNRITTINDIEKARLTDWLTRAELAKMMSQYMTNIQWKIPTIEKVEYWDVDESLGDLADFIQTAYSYRIMWINADGTPLENFNPDWLVTRAEYATVFSRVLYGDKYNKSEWNYYENHLTALKEAGILTNTTPIIQELRGRVMLMMYRSINPTSEETTEVATEETTQIANPASEYCIAQWWTINIVKDEEWNESGICKLADGTEIDEWEYFRENHKETETWSVEQPIEDSEWTGNTASWSTLIITATPNTETIK